MTFSIGQAVVTKQGRPGDVLEVNERGKRALVRWHDERRRDTWVWFVNLRDAESDQKASRHLIERALRERRNR